MNDGWRNLPGWPNAGGPGAASGFAELYSWWADCCARDGDVACEVGVFCGRSLMYLTRRLIDRGLMVHLYGIDAWSREAADHEFLAEMEKRGGPYLAAIGEM